jgi:hypothetical protein
MIFGHSATLFVISRRKPGGVPASPFFYLNRVGASRFVKPGPGALTSCPIRARTGRR